MAESARIVLSYARSDGEVIARDIGARLDEHALSWTMDHMALEGGEDWWRQFARTLDAGEHLVLVLTPGSLASKNCRREWEYAREHGKQVSPVRGAEGLSDAAMPRWMQAAHRYNLDNPEHSNRFLSVLRGAPRKWQVPFQARWPEEGEVFVERPAPLAEIKRRLLDEAGESVGITSALLGSGGFGKTGLAERICWDRDIIDAFHDGILWVTLGEKVSEADCIDHLNNLTFAVTGEKPPATRLEQAREAFGKALDNRRCLLVIDDAWFERDVRPFLRAGKDDQAARLITTRDREVLPRACRPVPVDAMAASEALARLVDGLDAAEMAPLRGQLEILATRRLGGWVQALGLANGFLRERVTDRQSLAGALADLSALLDARGVAGALDQRDSGSRQKTLAGSIDISLQRLRAEERARCEALAIFAEDADITLSSVGLLWDMPAAETNALCSRLRGLGLLRNLDLGARVLRLHDTMREVLGERLDAAEKARLHADFAARVQASYGADWRGLRDDYALRYLPLHLSKGGQEAATGALLLDAGWIMAKLHGTGLQTLLDDYRRYAGPVDGAAGLVGRALDLAAGPLASCPAELPGQMLGRLAASDAPGLAAPLAALRAAATPGALLPMRPTLTPPGAELRRLEGHAGGVNAVAMLDGGRIVSGSYDGTVLVWDAADGRELRRLEEHTDAVWSVAVLEGGRIVSGSYDKTVRVWDTADGRELSRLTLDAPVMALATSSDGHIIAGDGLGRLHVLEIARSRREG